LSIAIQRRIAVRPADIIPRSNRSRVWNQPISNRLRTRTGNCLNPERRSRSPRNRDTTRRIPTPDQRTCRVGSSMPSFVFSTLRPGRFIMVVSLVSVFYPSWRLNVRCCRLESTNLTWSRRIWDSQARRFWPGAQALAFAIFEVPIERE